uniref:PI3K-RBD domain-containing protein n=2 Tax=Lygus hesperus TaxID=30085 RepID=A0A146M5U6_LYGHE
MEPPVTVKLLHYLQLLYPVYVTYAVRNLRDRHPTQLRIVVYAPYALTSSAQQALSGKTEAERTALEQLYSQYKPRLFSHNVEVTTTADELLRLVVFEDLCQRRELVTDTVYPFLLKALGYHEYIYGSHEIQHFDFVYNCIRSHQDVVVVVEQRTRVSVEQLQQLLVHDYATRSSYLRRCDFRACNYFRQFSDTVYYRDRDQVSCFAYSPHYVLNWTGFSTACEKVRERHRRFIHHFLLSTPHVYHIRADVPDADVDVQYYVQELLRNGGLERYNTLMSTATFDPTTGLFDFSRNLLYNSIFFSDLVQLHSSPCHSVSSALCGGGGGDTDVVFTQEIDDVPPYDRRHPDDLKSTRAGCPTNPSTTIVDRDDELLTEELLASFDSVADDGMETWDTARRSGTAVLVDAVHRESVSQPSKVLTSASFTGKSTVPAPPRSLLKRSN